MRGDTEFKFGG